MNENPDSMNKLEIEAVFTDPTGAIIEQVREGQAELDALAAELVRRATAPTDTEATDTALRVRKAMWVVDVARHIKAFEHEVPLGAEFQRAYRTKRKGRTVIRLVWIAPIETQRVTFGFALQRMEEVFAVPVDPNTGTVLLGLVDDLEGEPIAIWQLPPVAPVAAPAPSPAEAPPPG